MISDTITSEEDYFKFVRNILLFTCLRSYNGQAQIWKDEDIEYIRNLNRQDEVDPELLKKSVEVYTRANAEYGDTILANRDNYTHLSDIDILDAFGFISPDEDDDGDAYAAMSLDFDLRALKKNDNYPKSFPVIVIQGDGDFKIHCVYPNDFNTPSKIEDFAWLEKNIRAFWTEGKGSHWGC
jgi:hypothetical protein